MNKNKKSNCKVKEKEIDPTFSKACHLIGTTEADISIICKDAGTSYYKMYMQAEHNEEMRTMLESALVDRAMLFFEHSKKIVDSIEEFWETIVVNRAGEHQVKRERSNAAQTAKLKVDFYMRACEMFAPMIFGDKSKELREVQKGLEELKGVVEAKAIRELNYVEADI